MTMSGAKSKSGPGPEYEEMKAVGKTTMTERDLREALAEKQYQNDEMTVGQVSRLLDAPPKADPNTRGATRGPFKVERDDNDDGSIAYEIWTSDLQDRVLRMVDNDNPRAKADAYLICKLLNNQHPE